MNNKVVLILVDGMRPDAVEQCEHRFLADLRRESTYCFKTETTFPSVTLPCHASLFFSVDPERHGITTNLWMPPVRPIPSLTDAAKAAGKKTAMLYNWEELRDLNRPGSLAYSHYQTGDIPHADAMSGEQEMTDMLIEHLDRESPDFVFLYLGHTDEAGHNYGWMGKEYMEALGNASACIQRLKESIPADYSLVITADHGGHERMHGTYDAEDMTIPVTFWGAPFAKGNELAALSIKDIAPTIAKVLDIPAPKQWDGRSII